MTTEIDSKIQKLFDRLQAKKKELEALEKPFSPKTNLSFPSDLAKSDRMNIQTANTEQIVHAMALLIGKVATFDQACKALDTKLPFSWGGSSFEDWQHDMQQRVARLSTQEKRKEFNDLEKKLNNIVSPEQRRMMELEAITKALE